MNGVKPALVLYQPREVSVSLGGVNVKAKAFRRGDDVFLQLDANTPIGKFDGLLHTDIASFEKMVEAAERHDVLPRAKAMIEHYTGRRLILAR